MNIPDEAVEAVAENMFQAVMGYCWSTQPPSTQGQWRTYASRSLRKAAPFLILQASGSCAAECACEISEEDHDKDGPDPVFLGRAFDATNCRRHGE